MTVARASRHWLDVREPADASARSVELVDVLASVMTRRCPITVHDLGCGTGSTRRWLAPRLAGGQRWIEHDRDTELLCRPGSQTVTSRDGHAVGVETRASDITKLTGDDLAGADLITASALLDMLTADELAGLASVWTPVGCPCLITLSVVGRVDLSPSDPLDAVVQHWFNEHQRRTVGPDRLLGPDAVTTMVALLERAGMKVITRASPWHLTAADGEVLDEWFEGWVAAACEQQPDLIPIAEPYAQRRRHQRADAVLHATVHHLDLLAWHP